VDEFISRTIPDSFRGVDVKDFSHGESGWSEQPSLARQSRETGIGWAGISQVVVQFGPLRDVVILSGAVFQA
jgi:hypothetical protein